jgi:arylsulfatase A-like enzyme
MSTVSDKKKMMIKPKENNNMFLRRASLFFAFMSFCMVHAFAQKNDRPNIIYILADDLGYGDLGVYNPAGRISTPNLDRLASQGMRFTDAHSPSSVCTPTRYAIMTGRYPWRSRLPVGVLRGYSRPLMEDDRATVASMLTEAGYHTGVIGKWHLGLGWAPKPEHAHRLDSAGYGIDQEMDPGHIDPDRPFTVSPNTNGFGYSYILPASLDMPPYCYVENGRLAEPLTSYTKQSKPDTGYAGAFWRAGLMSPSFDFYDVIPNFMRHANAFIRQQSTAKPFFLYLPLPAPHTPWVPASEFKGSSQVGEYGDFVGQLDASIGAMLKTLDSMGLSKNTIVIFTSDNGPYWRKDHVEKYGHASAGEWRGMKGDAYEGGHRVPFIVRWPGKVAPGTVSHATTTLTNLMATCADILGKKALRQFPEDSYSILPVLSGKSQHVPLQPAVVHSSSIGYFAIRQGDWKLIEGLGSGGFSVPKQIKQKPGGADAQLFNLKEDPREERDVYSGHPEVVKALRAQLDAIRKAGKRIELGQGR